MMTQLRAKLIVDAQRERARTAALTSTFPSLRFKTMYLFLAVMLCCGVVGAFAQAPSVWPPTKGELDNLAQRFRPYIKFSNGARQESRPVTWQYLYENSSLMKGSQIVIPLGGLAGSGAKQVLKFADITKDSQGSAAYRLKIDETHNAQYGEEWQQAAEGAGMYAHVSYLGPLTTQVPAVNLVNIEYWLLLGANIGPAQGVDDHQGDLVGVQVVYDRVSDKLVRVAFSEHGSSLIMFDLLHSKSPEEATLHGQDAQGNHITQAACKVNAQDKGFYSGGTGMTNGGEHHLFLARDPATNKCEHVALYLERGSHEPWPNQTGWFVFVGGHNGDNFSYLPASVHVLSTAVDAPFINFGGFLGNSDGPAAITRHRMWLGFDTNQSADRNPYEDHDNLKWLPTVGINE